eukprot:CAMPEP_0113699730 /NCGR_PEP_ID=MMETSP0038_2-20120614/23512_1 /TAXON_ID=2898 /ORGANISM="Cryptomonas paramecium" /LENGTH=64 /DNA_ID=CAMNT_0000623205 /DNA_START=351 /DNA_END=545 /DNA_ORIENTATION=- /assembly_acc=CAM_ASM_000170
MSKLYDDSRYLLFAATNKDSMKREPASNIKEMDMTINLPAKTTLRENNTEADLSSEWIVMKSSR